MSTQIRQCECGQKTSERKCPECDCVTWPMWNVVDNQGRFRGQVAGDSHNDALQSVTQSVAFDSLKSFTVREATV